MKNVEDAQQTEDLLQLVSFKIGDEEFGVDILKVQEINRMMEITEIPNSPVFVEGVVNLRGRIIPVIDLRKRLNMDTIKHDSKTRIVVVDLDSKIVGFIVDEVSEVLRIPVSITEPPPEMVVSGVDSDYITSVAKLDDRLLILLELNKVLSASEQSELADA